MQALMPNRPIKAESSSSSKTSSPRKRVARACDECRLHKSRCDGLIPCKTCSCHTRTCSYNLLPVECKGPGARVRILEHRLAKARVRIDDLQKQIAEDATTKLSHEQASQSQYLQPFSPLSDIRLSANVVPGPHQTTDSSPTNLEKHEGIGRNLIASLLQPFFANRQIRDLVDSKLVTAFLCDVEASNRSPDRTCQLPPYNTMLEIVYAAFNSNFGLCNIIVEQEFRILTQRLYDVRPDDYTPEDIEFIPLFGSIMALGMICCASLHRIIEYEDAVKESLIFFEVASLSIDNDQGCTSLLKLQTALCLVLYLLNTYKLDLVRPAIRIVCASSLVQVALRDLLSQDADSDLPVTRRTRSLIWAIYFIDMHVAELLGLPCLLPKPGPELGTIHAINSAAYNVSNLRRSDALFLITLAVAMAIELMKIMNRLSTSILPDKHDPEKGLETARKVSLPKWFELETELETWKMMLHDVFPRDDNNPILFLARHYLLCHLYLAQMMLYHSYLPCHSSSKAMRTPTEIDHIDRAQSCLVAATGTVKHVSSYIDHTQTMALPFHSAYVLFISLLTLMVAVTTTEAIGQVVLLQDIHNAIHVLVHAKYGSLTTKTSYLEFVKTLAISLGINISIPSIPPASDISSSTQAPTSFSPMADITPITASSVSNNVYSDGTKSMVPKIQPESSVSPDVWGFD